MNCFKYLCLILVLFTKNANGQSCTSLNLLNFRDEYDDILDKTSDYAKSYYCKSGGIYYSFNKPYMQNIERIPVDYLNTIKHDVYIATPALNDSTWGLKVYYAIKDKRPFLIYKPVLLIHKNTFSHEYSYDVHENESGLYYYSFTDQSNTTLNHYENLNEAQPYIDIYQNTVSFKLEGATQYTPISIDYAANTNPSIFSDPAAVIFIWDEIDSLIGGNTEIVAKNINNKLMSLLNSYQSFALNDTSIAKVKQKKALDSLFVKLLETNVIAVDFHNGVNLYQGANGDRLIHNVYMLPHFKTVIGTINPASENELFGYGANLGSLCPPNCQIARFPCK